MTATTIAVNGACGRMGQLIARGVLSDPELQLSAAIVEPVEPGLGRDIGEILGIGAVGVPTTTALSDRVDCVIDFSVPQASVEIARTCGERGIPLLVATTGHSDSQKEEILACHHETALLVASNTSLVVNVMMKLVADAGRLLKGKDFDVEIVERHHRFKVDAPSGTALRFAEIVSEAMGLEERIHGREGITGARPRTQLGVHAIRGGDNVGEHTVLFATLGESLELVHRGTSRDSYVKGALEGAKFLAGKKPGLYSMNDVLGIG